MPGGPLTSKPTWFSDIPPGVYVPDHFKHNSSASTRPPSKLTATFLILKETVASWMEDKAMRLSAALALYTILSLAPLLVITIKLFSVIYRNRDFAQARVMDQITNLMGWRIAQAVQPILENSSKPEGGLLATVISSAVLFFSATGVFAELQDSMNTIWGVKPKPNRGIRDFIRHRLLSLAMVLGIGFLLLVSMFVTTLVNSMAMYIAGGLKWFAVALDVIASFVVVSVLFAAIFEFLPDVKLKGKNVWSGAMLTAGLFTVGKYLLAVYFKFATPTSVFGAAGSLAAILLWVYYSSFILFFGAEFTKIWSLRQVGTPIVPTDHAVKVTEEERARQGIPTGKRMQDSLAGSSFIPRPPLTHQSVFDEPSF